MDVLSGYANLNLKLLLYSQQRMISLKQFFLETSKNKGRNTGKNNCGGGDLKTTEKFVTFNCSLLNLKGSK